MDVLLYQNLNAWQENFQKKLKEEPVDWPHFYLRIEIPQGFLWMSQDKWEQMAGDLQPLSSPLPIPWLGGIVAWRGVVHTILKWFEFLGLTSNAKQEKNIFWLIRSTPQPITWPIPFPISFYFNQQDFELDDDQENNPNQFCQKIKGLENHWLLDAEGLLSSMYDADPQFVLQALAQEKNPSFVQEK